jgi:hypothetical protein
MANRPITRQEQINASRMINLVFGAKLWAEAIQASIPDDYDTYKGFVSMLKYVEMVQKQVRGLEENIRNIR